MENRNRTLSLVFALLGSVVLLFVAAPILGMFFSSPLHSLFEAAKDKEVSNSIALTLCLSFSATLIVAILSIPLAYLLARKNFIFKGLIRGIIDLPVVIPHSAAGIALIGFLSRDSSVGKFASWFGIDFVGHQAGIIAAMAFVSLPFLINPAINGFEAVSEKLEKAAMNLGASPARVFFSVSLPLAKQNIVSGLVMMFARGMSEFGAVVIIAYHPMITPVLIFERFGAFGLSYSKPVAAIFVAICLLVFILLRWLSKNKTIEKH